MSTITAATAVTRLAEIQAEGTIEQVSRYELEKCAHALWQVIVVNDVSDEIFTAWQQFKTELTLRTNLGH